MLRIMYGKQLYFATLLIVIISNVNSQEETLLCINKDLALNKTNVYNSEYQSSTIECIKRLEKEIVKFTIANSFEALLASTFSSENTTVVGYFAPDETDTLLGTVVLTKGKRLLDDVKGLRYCHPGEGANIPSSISHELLREILRRDKKGVCGDKQLRIPEYYYQYLNITLGPSCIAGQWAADDDLDSTLKKRFPKLLELCRTYDKTLDSFRQSLQCLLNGEGDIALTSLQTLNEMKDKINDKYLTLCKDNTLQTFRNACVWSKQSRNLLLAHKDHAERFHKAIEKLQEMSYNETFVNISNPMSLGTYMNNFGEVPTIDDKITCKRSVIWCTLTDEETEYCNLLRSSFLIYGIQPGIQECKQLRTEYLDKYECIDSISKGSSHITFLNSDELYTAKKAQLEVVMYANNDEHNLLRSILVVNHTTIKTKEDLKNKPACFSEFASIDWLSFVSAYKDDILKTSCFYDEELSKFIGESCMPGVRDNYRKAKTNTNVERACKNCLASRISETAVNCDANYAYNVYATSKGALDCLEEKAGDYAVIKVEDEDRLRNLNSSFKIMCKHNKFVEFSKNMDEDCYLSITPSGALVTKDNSTAHDIRLAFMEVNKLQFNRGVFSFNPYVDTKNSLFNGAVTNFSEGESCDSDCNHVDKLATLVKEVDTCTKPINELQASSMSPLAITIIVLIVLVLTGVAGYYTYTYLQKKRPEHMPVLQDEPAPFPHAETEVTTRDSSHEEEAQHNST